MSEEQIGKWAKKGDWHPIKATSKWDAWVKKMAADTERSVDEREARHRNRVSDTDYTKTAEAAKKTEG